MPICSNIYCFPFHDVQIHDNCVVFYFGNEKNFCCATLKCVSNQYVYSSTINANMWTDDIFSSCYLQTKLYAKINKSNLRKFFERKPSFYLIFQSFYSFLNHEINSSWIMKIIVSSLLNHDIKSKLLNFNQGHYSLHVQLCMRHQ